MSHVLKTKQSRQKLLLRVSLRITLTICWAFFAALSAFAGENLRIGVYSGTFNPPHDGHRETIVRMIHSLHLDRIYVIPNVTSDHKSGVESYENRRQMSVLAFGDIPQAEVANSRLEGAFRAQDMTGVLTVLREVYPESSLFQIMGDDSFERYKKVRDRRHFDDLEIVIVPRSGSQMAENAIAHYRDSRDPRNPNEPIEPLRLPPLEDGTRVQLQNISPTEALGQGLSSTAVRNAVANGNRIDGINPGVWDYIQTHGLYQSGARAKCVESQLQLLGPNGPKTD